MIVTRFQAGRFQTWLTILLVLVSSSYSFGQNASAQTEQLGLNIPSHPRELKFPKLTYDSPKPLNYRRVLSNNAVAFLAEDHDFPLVNVSILIRTGSYLDPKGKEGLAVMVGSQLRAGGTTRMTADAFDEEAAFLAANITSNLSDTQGNASVNCLTKDIDRALSVGGGLEDRLYWHVAVICRRERDLHRCKRCHQPIHRADHIADDAVLSRT